MNYYYHFRKTLVFLLFSLSISYASNAQCPPPLHPDYNALMALYNATDGPNWQVNSGWSQGAAGFNCDPCSWYGIECENILNRVISLDLSGNLLTGQISIEISNLDSLKTLDLGANSLFGSIPQELTLLPSLETLRLHHNQLSGAIPPSFGLSLILTSLELHNNNLSGAIPIELALSTSLEHIYLQHNELSGPLHPEFAELPDLPILILSNNNLEGCIPSEFMNYYLYVYGYWFFIENNPRLPWNGDTGSFYQSGGDISEQIGTPCDDGDALTLNDTINLDCSCGSSALFDSYYSINVHSYLDMNNNAQFDTINDYILYNQQYNTNPNYSYFTLWNGSGLFLLDTVLNLQLNYIQNTNWLAPINPNLIQMNSLDLSYTIYVELEPTALIKKCNVDITSSIVRCNREVNYWITIQNNGTTFITDTTNVVLDDSLSFVSSFIIPDSINGNTLTFSYDSLPPTHSITYHLIVETPGVGALGDIMTVEAVSSTFSSIYERELVCAYDPNDKLVEPAGVYEQNFTSFEDSVLTYTIRFQNTGNDTAFNVIVRDSISELLDMDSYHFIAASHDMTMEMDRDQNLLSFHFENILLPDSNVNEVASHGFVKFQLEIVDGMDEGTPIENTAEIYFDQNPEIVTNTTLNTFATPPFISPTSVEEIIEVPAIELFPNPAMDILNVRLPRSISAESAGYIQILTMQGQEVLTESSTHETAIELDVSRLDKGIYLVQYHIEEQTINKKFVKM